MIFTKFPFANSFIRKVKDKKGIRKVKARLRICKENADDFRQSQLFSPCLFYITFSVRIGLYQFILKNAGKGKRELTSKVFLFRVLLKHGTSFVNGPCLPSLQLCRVSDVAYRRSTLSSWISMC